MTENIELPDRRQLRTEKLNYGGQSYYVSAGFNVDGTVREIFINCSQTGSEMERLIDDFCFGISKLLQTGERVFELASSMSDLGLDYPGMKPEQNAGSLFGAALFLAAKIETECCDEVIEFYRAAGLV